MNDRMQQERKMGPEKRQAGCKPTGTKNRKGRILWIGGFLVLAVILAGGALYGRNVKKAQEGKQEEAAAGQEKGLPGETGRRPKEDILAKYGITVPEKELDWEGLLNTNKDIYAWIYIPGTGIDYPVLQHPTDDQFYLEHNLDGSEGYPGCIYSEPGWNNRGFLDTNTVLYGHNMSDGTMFAQLHNYREEAFFDENRYVFLYTPQQEVYVYDIFAAYESGNEHILYTYNFVSEAGYQEYLDKVFGVRDMGAQFRDGVQVGIQNHILTLSTCIADKPDNRYLVQGVLVNDPTLEASGENGGAGQEE